MSAEPPAPALPLTPPKYLSPSSIFTFFQCPAKFKYTRIDKLDDPSGIDAIRGSMVHDVLERLYRLPAAERTLGAARAIAAEVFPTWRDDAGDLLRTEGDERGFRWQVWWAVENLFRLEDPATREHDGLETYVEGTIRGALVRGYVDRWHRSDEGLVIGDYKSGKTPKAKYRGDKFTQLLIYGILLAEQEQTPVAEVELLFLKFGDRLTLTVQEEHICHTEGVIQRAAAGIAERCDTGEFETKPSILCDWCTFKTTICPYWKRN